jgi:hypothetical protein
MAQVAECLPHKHEALNPTPLLQKKKKIFSQNCFWELVVEIICRSVYKHYLTYVFQNEL